MQQRAQISPNTYPDDSAIDIDRVGGVLLQKLWAVLLVAVLLASAFYFFAKAAYVEEYISSATLAFTTTTYITEKDENGQEIGILTQKKHYTEKDVDRYQFLLKSDVMVQQIYDALGNNQSKAAIEKSLSVNSTTIAGIFTVNVMNSDKKFCQDAIHVVIKIFPDYLKSFDTSLGIDVIKNPKIPVAYNVDGASKKALYGFVIGAALVIIIIFIAEVSSDTVRRIDDIREKINVKFLGSIPTVEGKRGHRGKNKLRRNFLLTEENHVSFSFIESFKAIRTKIENVAAEKGYKLFIVTSTFENEGKTTVAINLACALAQKGKSVLLMDCDLRKPSVMRMAGIKEDEKSGLVHIIKAESTYTESIKFIKPLGIFVLPSGGVSPKSTEVLDADKVKDVINRAGAEFDYVIMDTPPARVVADCLVLAPLADALIFTIKRDYAKIRDINETLEEISTTGIDVIGSVLTMNNEEGSSRYFSRKGSLYYYRHHRDYFKGYSPYGYEASSEKKQT